MIGLEKVNREGLTEREFLERYSPADYERPSVTVDMLLFAMSEKLDTLKVLLIQRKDHPYIGSWALAGGFVGISESAYEAACRELSEETGLSNVYLEQLYTMSKPERDPRMRVISIAYMALMQEMPVVAGDDACDAVWCDVLFDDRKLCITNKEVGVDIRYGLRKKEFVNGVVKTVGYAPVLKSEDSLAFDHADIILEGLLRLRNKLEYSDIAFNLMNREFTLPDLQRVYEIILGRELYKVNFRSKMLGKVELTGRKGRSITGNRQSDLYRYAR